MKIDIHLPDLLFVRQIEETFQINRGVYNTIDAWLYEKGQNDITERRKKIVAFLQYIQKEVIDESTSNRLYFPDGLTNTLNNYFELQKTG